MCRKRVWSEPLENHGKKPYRLINTGYEMKIAAIGDLHCTRDSSGKMYEILSGVEEDADVLVLAGDLTNTGLAKEMEVLLEDLDRLALPKVAVTGNHDHESDQVELLTSMMRSRGIHVLDGTACEIGGVGFVGIKGFCGGFGRLRIQAFGERALKTFIEGSINEAVSLEKAAMALDSAHKVGVLHYSPVKETLRGEEPELYPFLGSSLLGEALDRHGVDVMVHGHAHKGVPRGVTSRKTPVYNVARFVQRRFGTKSYFCFDVG